MNVTHLGVLDSSALLPNPDPQAHDRVAVHASNPLNRPNAAAFGQHGDHVTFFSNGRLFAIAFLIVD